jgi:hypothetical protein
MATRTLGGIVFTPPDPRLCVLDSCLQHRGIDSWSRPAAGQACQCLDCLEFRLTRKK